ncbi:pilin [Methylotenera sp.]|uniref:pilin n=1 Tax=Methylotenera sp. TaxID=2051956 RepID=UPI002725B4B5|nr:pilin [Methylotenera sp.]MDO9204038.1 pilin [Methylotenera sp.]
MLKNEAYFQAKVQGFSAIEMMVVVAIIAILAMIAIPSSMGRIVKEQVQAALPLADIAKEPVVATWKMSKKLPADNKEAGLPAPELIVSNLISAVELQDGVIHMTFGNKAHPKIKGKILSIRPAVIEESQIVPVAWVCGKAKAPDKMALKGDNKTNISDEYLPYLCK